jgi:hypothetical protein
VKHDWRPNFVLTAATPTEPARYDFEGSRCARCARLSKLPPFLVGPHQSSPLREARRYPPCVDKPANRPKRAGA